jgi:hypothetical protein
MTKEYGHISDAFDMLPEEELLMTDTWKKWTIWTSIYVFDYCVFSWRNHMWPHLDGYADKGMMKTLFWHYLNYGNTNTYYD